MATGGFFAERRGLGGQAGAGSGSGSGAIDAMPSANSSLATP